MKQRRKRARVSTEGWLPLEEPYYARNAAPTGRTHKEEVGVDYGGHIPSPPKPASSDIEHSGGTKRGGSKGGGGNCGTGAGGFKPGNTCQHPHAGSHATAGASGLDPDTEAVVEALTGGPDDMPGGGLDALEGGEPAGVGGPSTPGVPTTRRARLAAKLAAKKQRAAELAKEVGEKLLQTKRNLPRPVQGVMDSALAAFKAWQYVVSTPQRVGLALAERIMDRREFTDEERTAKLKQLKSWDFWSSLPISITGGVVTGAGLFGVSLGTAAPLVPLAGTAAFRTLARTPIGTGMYLTYSLATHPWLTAKGAKDLVKDYQDAGLAGLKTLAGATRKRLRARKAAKAFPTVKPTLEHLGPRNTLLGGPFTPGTYNQATTNEGADPYNMGQALADVLDAHDWDDWFIALLGVAGDIVDNPEDAIELARAIYAEHPESPYAGMEELGTEEQQELFSELEGDVLERTSHLTQPRGTPGTKVSSKPGLVGTVDHDPQDDYYTPDEEGDEYSTGDEDGWRPVR